MILAENGSGVAATEYPNRPADDVVGPTVYGHAGAPGAIAVGAVPFSNGDVAEPYTSRGPVTHYFGPVRRQNPGGATRLAQTIPKPDLAATDCGRTTFFVPSGEPGVFRFCGTSAAAPHAAGGRRPRPAGRTRPPRRRRSAPASPPPRGRSAPSGPTPSAPA